jgi:hypothetical protein
MRYASPIHSCAYLHPVVFLLSFLYNNPGENYLDLWCQLTRKFYLLRRETRMMEECVQVLEVVGGYSLGFDQNFKRDGLRFRGADMMLCVAACCTCNLNEFDSTMADLT